ncbi:hypothetical protein ACFLTB_02695 [Chloroflexota bacterium]
MANTKKERESDVRGYQEELDMDNVGMEVKEIVYFDEPGPANTKKILEFSKKRIEALGINRVVIGSASGFTVKNLVEMTKDTNPKLDIVAVTFGSEENPPKMPTPAEWFYDHYEHAKRIKENLKRGIGLRKTSIYIDSREEFEKAGVRVFRMPLAGLNLGDPHGLNEEQKYVRDMLRPFVSSIDHLRPSDIQAGVDMSLFTIISQGFRICLVCTILVTKNGLIPEGEPVLAIAGTGFAGGGSDTAIIVQAGSSAKTCLVREIIGLPKLK